VKRKIMVEHEIDVDGDLCITLDEQGEDVSRCPLLHEPYVDGKHLVGSLTRCLAFPGTLLREGPCGPERCEQCLKLAPAGKEGWVYKICPECGYGDSYKVEESNKCGYCQAILPSKEVSK